MPKPFGPIDVLQTCGTQRAVRSIARKNSAQCSSAIDHRFAACCLSGFLQVVFYSLFRRDLTQDTLLLLRERESCIQGLILGFTDWVFEELEI